ncbi:MAG: sulfur carrier protein ThiS [Bacteroidales bacterium]
MKITLNNKEEAFDKDELTISQLLDIQNYSYKMLVVKVNGELVKKAAYDNTKVKDGDDVMVLHLVTGG